MARISCTRTLAAEQKDVWDVLADFGAISSWAGIADHSCMLEHNTDGGAIGSSRRVQVGRSTLVERITDYEPQRALAYDVEGLPRALRRVNNQWSLRPVGGGSTEVALTSTVEIGPHLIQRIAERAVCVLLAKQTAALLSGLAIRVEEFHA